MSIFSDIGNAVSSAVSSVANIAMEVAPIIFPQLALAATVTNMVSQVAGQAVNQAVQQLCKESGMPKFLQDIVGKCVKEALQGLCKPSDSDCDKHIKDHFGNDFRELADQLSTTIADAVKKIKCGGGDEDSSSSSWLVAIAKAMGSAAGKHAQKVAELSNKIDTLNGSDPKQAAEATKLQNEMQGETQMLSLMMTAFSTAIKTIGESMKTMAGKN